MTFRSELCALVALLVALLVACGPSAPSSSPSPSSWAGVYDLSITATVTPIAGAPQTATGAELVTVVQVDTRVTWTRPDGCAITWRAQDATAVADVGQLCTLMSGGRRFVARVTTGESTRTGATLDATVRWSLASETGEALGSLVAMFHGSRR